MKSPAILAGLMLACASLSVPAQYDRERDWRRGNGPAECWNPRAGHFESVRRGERQDDLDFSRCRPVERNWHERYKHMGRECWNPRARHFEAVRPGERQNDLDFSRCHPVGGREPSRDRDRDRGRECWNPRAGHYEAVRPGERQNDLDFSRCRRR